METCPIPVSGAVARRITSRAWKHSDTRRSRVGWIAPVALMALITSAPVSAEAARLTEAFGGGGSSWSLHRRAGGEPTTGVAGAARWQRDREHAIVEPPADGFAVASYTVPAGGAGFYAIADSFLRRDAAQPGQIELRVQVGRQHASTTQVPVVATRLEAGELFDFDAFLGYLDAGDVVQVAIGAAGDAAGDRTEIDFRLERAPSIPVTVFPEDLSNGETVDAPGGWSVARGVSAGSAAARRLAWSGDADAPAPGGAGRLALNAADGGATLVAFRVPQSGFYALHEAWFAAQGAAVETRVFVGDESAAQRTLRAEAGAGHENLNTEIGYVSKGDVVYLAFAPADGGVRAEVEFGGTIVEWAPRRAPLRVRRGADGYLDVYEPEAPRRAVDIPAARWISVRAPEGGRDATTALREALAQARAMQRGEEYVGVRLEAGTTYVVASTQVGGTVFAIDNTRRVVLDGNGATLRVASPELTRKEVDLFVLARSRDIVLADLVVEATTIPFTTGEIVDVSPRGETTQTVTFRVDAGALDPLQDISRDGRNNAYAYDPAIPGRLALGTWTHYPGSGNPSIRATNTPGVFTHRVTRTNDSIEPGGKWLIKNKRGGVVYLTTRAGTENVTLSGIDGRAAGGGHLRFWQTSGVNILDCRFEPDGDNWISSSADGVHGRGREGVWIENTLIRGICEDIMNTYGQNMIVIADDEPDDTTMSIRMFTRSSESFDDGAARVPTEESVAVGDQLVFFDPRTGRVQGYAGVVAIANGRYTLTNTVPGIDPWDEGDGKHATMVYNTRAAGRFFVRDTRMMDSMRFGVYIKARGGVVFGSQFEGLSAPAIFATNEPEWPEGPPATHLWVQGCTFSQNNHGYMARHRDFMVVDPADISIYTRRFRQADEADDFRANLTRDQYANSHMKLIGNVFHDWRGMGIAVRNSRNARIEDNVFLPPVNDDVMRRTLADDPALNVDGRGTYAAIYLDSVGGARVSGNRFHGLAAGDRGLVSDRDVAGLTESDNAVLAHGAKEGVALSFDEWFGDTSVARGPGGETKGNVRLGGGKHRAGRLGGGVFFAGGAPATLERVEGWGGKALEAFGLAGWIRLEGAGDGAGAVLIAGDETDGVAVALNAGRWRAVLRQGGEGEWLDLGAATPGLWQHLALAFDGVARELRGYVDSVEIARVNGTLAAVDVPAKGAFGGGAFRGGIDEVRWTTAKWSRVDLAALALRKPPEASR